MRKGRNEPSKLPWETVVLMEVPWGFAFFDVSTYIFRMPVNMIWAHFTNREPINRAAYFLDLVKCDGKSALWRSSSCGRDRSFVDLVKEYSSRARRFIVEDEQLRNLIKTKLGIVSTTEEEVVVREVTWGLRNGLIFMISQYMYRITISPQPHLPLCGGFRVLMKKYKIEIPTEAVDEDFLTTAGTLQRIEELKLCCCVVMRKKCAKLVPGISEIIKDNPGYVEVMAKILTPWLVDEEWDSSKWSTWFTPDVMQKIVAEDAAAEDAREKVKGDRKLDAIIRNNLNEYRYFSEREGELLGILRSSEANAKRGQKRSRTEVSEEVVEAGEEVVEAGAEWEKGEDGAHVTEEK